MFRRKKAAASEPPPQCDLCGLDAPGEEFLLDTGDRRLRFCCDGCLGIYCLLNGIEQRPGAGAPGE